MVCLPEAISEDRGRAYVQWVLTNIARVCKRSAAFLDENSEPGTDLNVLATGCTLHVFGTPPKARVLCKICAS